MGRSLGGMGAIDGALLGSAASGIAGLRRAGDLQSSAAQQVTQAFSPAPSGGSSAATVKISSVSQDLASAFGDMMKAEGMNKANVAVIQTADGMMKDLMKIVG